MTAIDDAARSSEARLALLAHQGRNLREHTRILLKYAGVTPGQRMLDIGCGVGDIALLASELLGLRGSIVSVDKCEASIVAARQRAASSGISNAEFRVADFESLDGVGQFDVITGRLVIGHMPKPADTLRRLLRNLRTGGTVVCQELDLSSASATPHCPTFAYVCQWLGAALRHLGRDPDSGKSLYANMRAAGLTPRGSWVSQPTFFGYETAIGDWAVHSVLNFKDAIVASGVADEAALELDTLAVRLQAEFVSKDAFVFAPRMVGVWASAA
jgi:ubiquinone/menaquinone biosynthesis C-methylase UbiE